MLEQIIFCDLTYTFTAQLQDQFKFDHFPVKIDYYTGNIRDMIAPPNSCYLSPANSFGYMDGGIDAVYSIMFPGIQQLVQERIKSYPYKTRLDLSYLPIGSSLLIDLNLLNTRREMKTVPLHDNTANESNCYLISAPTMWRPQDVSMTNNAYYAMLSTLSLIRKYNETALPTRQIKTLICPGLCTGYGKMSYKQSAEQISQAMIEFYNHIRITSDHMHSDPTSILKELGVNEQAKIYMNTEIKEINLEETE
jgi:O-acetyl-ADP-ribose deacetylase (regulator of RNase III)